MNSNLEFKMRFEIVLALFVCSTLSYKEGVAAVI